MNFPTTFCCNCGDTNCMTEIQDTRVTRYYGVGGVETTFQLPIPVCVACLKTTRRRPSGWFSRLLVWGITICVVFGALIVLGENATFPVWLSEHLFAISAGVALLLVIAFYRLRRPKPPQTSFYQPVRIKEARVNFNDGDGRVGYMKLAFTNHDYLNVFTTANRDAIEAKVLAAVKA
ncbi:MAG TPA: hypothetical protein VM146_18030 [Steroidobacteraceae bacterium]|nr:hypothetical protein [Steroidobacteraceae bacterium]